MRTGEGRDRYTGEYAVVLRFGEGGTSRSVCALAVSEGAVVMLYKD